MSGDHNMYQKSKSYLDDFECPRCGHCCHIEGEHTNTLRQAAQKAVQVMDAHMMRADTDEFYEAKENLRQALDTKTMKPKFMQLLERCIVNGVILGHNRAYKHNATPERYEINQSICNEVMNEIHEWFDFDEGKL